MLNPGQRSTTPTIEFDVPSLRVEAKDSVAAGGTFDAQHWQQEILVP